ncbi:MAG: hypothetical protein U1E66_08300 [Rhodospirillales bacterium]
MSQPPPPAPRGEPSAIRLSPLLMALPARLAVAAALTALLWLAVAWSLPW